MRMKIIGLLVVVLAFSGVARAQSQPRPHLFLVMPMGGQAGTSFDVVVTGQNLATPEGLYFSIPGAKAEYIGPGSNPKVVGKQPKIPGPQASFRFKVTLPEDAKPGIQDIRVVTKGGISNPRAFVVSDLKESVETEPNDDVPQANKVELNSTVNGVISAPTDVDYFQFSGKKGQRVVLSCLTSSIDSKLDAMIEVYSKDDRYLGSGRGYHERDALMDCTLPADGDYLVRVSSFTYTQGGPDYYYRLTISTAPWIDAVFPTTIEPGKEAEVTFYGRNLPGGKLDPAMTVAGRELETLTVTVKAPAGPEAAQRLQFGGWIGPSSSGLDGFEWHLKNDAGSSNPILFTFAAAPVVLDNGKNDSVETAQPVTIPCEIAGRIEKKGDRDWYSFHAQKGIYTIELIGDRLGAPLDLYFLLQDAKGKTITEQDDPQPNEILSPQLFNHTFDPPAYRFVVPADGDYHILVASRDGFVQAGPRHCYQLRITPQRPDFRLVAMPAPTVFPPQNIVTQPDGNVVGQGGNQAIQLLVWRRDGFNSDITLTAKGLPEGITVAPQVLPAGQKLSYLVLNATPDAPAWTGPIQIIGTATVKGEKLVRAARSATISWPTQNNVPAVSRLDRSLVLAVRDQAPFSLSAPRETFSAFPGGKIKVSIKLKRNGMTGNVQLLPLSIPAGLTFNPTNLKLDSGEMNIVLDVKQNAAPGLFTVVLRGTTQGVGMVKGKGKPPVGGINQVSTPISVMVLPKQVAKLTVTPQTQKGIAGKDSSIMVKVARIYDFDGPFKVELLAPPGGAKGIQAPETQIKAGENEAKLVLQVPTGTPPGNYQNFTVRATAQFQGHAVVHETKINVNVVKAK
jgi:hypothetical protein